jgi:hypothetical protein
MQTKRQGFAILLLYIFVISLTSQDCIEYKNSLSCNGVYIEAQYILSSTYIDDSLRIEFTIRNERDHSILIFDPSYYLNDTAIVSEFYPAFPGFAYELGGGWSYSLEFDQYLYLVEIQAGDEFQFTADFPKEFLLTRGHTDMQKLKSFIRLGQIDFRFIFGFIELVDEIEFLVEEDLSPLEITATGFSEYFDLHLERVELRVIHVRKYIGDL